MAAASMSRSTRYTPPSLSTKEVVRLAISVVARSVMAETIRGSTSSHTVVSAAQNRSMATVLPYFL